MSFRLTRMVVSLPMLAYCEAAEIRPKDLDDAFAQMDFEVEHNSTPMDVPPPPDAMDVDTTRAMERTMRRATSRRRRLILETETKWSLGQSYGGMASLALYFPGGESSSHAWERHCGSKCCKCGACMVPSAEAEADRVSEPVVETACGGGCAENGDVLQGALIRPAAYLHQAVCCLDCGEFFECLECSLDRHAWSPLHVLQVWRDESWHRRVFATCSGVPGWTPGGRCIYPDKTPRLMTVIHVNRITLNFLKWWYPASTRILDMRNDGVLRLFRRLRVIATINVRDFLTVLERMTDPYGTEYTRTDIRCSLESRASGLAEAKPGSLIVNCWACPRVGVNLPADWELVDEKYHYRYQGMYSVDANFRMNCKMRPEPRPDLPLYDGLGVQMPTEMYHDWLRQYITKEDVTSCISFAALMQKDTRFSVGLRPWGFTEGERYKNTDFVLYTVLSRMGLKEITVTYDIACQYKKHFFERIKALPPALQDIMGELPNIQWALPVWHGNVHEVKCEASESLKFKVGVGKTDGEGIERVWAVLNPFSYMTKEQLPGARHDNIEDKINYHNFTKNINLGKPILERRCFVA
ncbi:hypothetical protein CPB85DRAFT_1443381 [Mucidula mucida]|nr:hypothetical protein CPB85DRAFT_1443381 [Mucidula mucida]